MTKRSSNTLHEPKVSGAKTFSSATVQISKRMPEEPKSIDSRRSKPQSKSSFASEPKTNSMLLKTEEMHKMSVDKDKKESKLPRHDSKVGLAMQQGLRNYIQRLKIILSERENYLFDSQELVSLSLTDAILPEVRTDLSDNEIQELQDLFNKAEKVGVKCEKFDVLS